LAETLKKKKMMGVKIELLPYEIVLSDRRKRGEEK
jgi:hypothetical protein